MESRPHWIVVEREVLVDDARAFRTLIAHMRDVLSREQARGNAEPAIAEPILAPPAAGRANRLARQLLAYAGERPLAPARLEPHPFLCDLADTLRRTLDARIAVAVDVGHDCPPCHADRAALEEALVNLIANARDAMPEGGRLFLEARACELPDARPGVEISVSDSGPGMGAEALRRVGQPFFTTKTGLSLAGMGLAAANGFARGSGGVLAVCCAPAEGLTVALRLPQPAQSD